MDNLPLLETKDGCIATAMDIIGNKWTALILRDLFTGPKRFSELEKSVQNINPRTLSKRLVILERLGIINKKIYPKQSPHSQYSLTEKGEDLLPIVQSMSEWGAKYYDFNNEKQNC